MPFHEPIVGASSGISTETLIATHGPIVARGLTTDAQCVAFANAHAARPRHHIFTSERYSDTWLPWSLVPRATLRGLKRLVAHGRLVLEVA